MGTDAAGGEVSARPAEATLTVGERSSRRSSARVLNTAERDRMLKEARDIDFPIALRGYDRAAVDRYAERVTRMVTELEMSASPEAAVRHALDEVSEETRDILQHAHQTADDITARSRAKADERLEEAEREAQETRTAAQQAAEETREAARRAGQEIREEAQREAQKLREVTATEAQSLRDVAQREVADLRQSTVQEMTALRETTARESQQLRAEAQQEADTLLTNARQEAAEMRERAEAHARELARSAEAIWRERRRLIDDMRAVGEQLVAIGEAEAHRFPHLADGIPVGDDHPRAQVPTPPGAVSEETPGEDAERHIPGSSAATTATQSTRAPDKAVTP